MFGRRPKIDTTFGVPMDLNIPFGSPVRDRSKDPTFEVNYAARHRRKEKTLPSAPMAWDGTVQSTQNPPDAKSKTMRPLSKIPLRFLIGGAIALWFINPLLLIAVGFVLVFFFVTKSQSGKDPQS